MQGTLLFRMFRNLESANDFRAVLGISKLSSRHGPALLIETHSHAAERAHSAWFRSRLSGHLCDYEVVSRGVCHVTAVGRLPVTAVGGPQRLGDMYQNPAACLRLIEDAGMYKSIRLRTEEPRYAGGGCVLELGRLSRPRSSPTTPRRSSSGAQSDRFP